jgi:hypothetical protein
MSRAYGDLNYGDCYYGGTTFVSPVEYPLTEDPANPGLFLVPPGFTEDPANPGLWLLDGTVTYYLIEDPVDSGLFYLALTEGGCGEFTLRAKPCPQQQPAASGPADRLANLVPCPEGANC